MNLLARTAPLLAATTLLLPALAADWPQYRGPSHDGSSPEQIRTNWNTTPPRVLWRKAINPGWSSITVAGNRAFTQVRRTSAGTAREFCVAFDTSTGTELWAREVDLAIYSDLAGAKERARRTACLSNERQFFFAALLYANDNDQRLPRPDTDNSNKNDTHTPILSNVTKTNLLRYSGDLKSLDCPNLHQWMLRKNGWRVHDDYGVAIGYHYLGGHPNTPWKPLGAITNTWTSPQKADEDPTLVLVADLNVYCYSFPRILAPHTAYSQSVKDEAYFDEVSEAYSQTPADIGAQGGNVGKLDGSAAWKNLKDMRTYRASFLWEADGAFGMW